MMNRRQELLLKDVRLPDGRVADVLCRQGVVEHTGSGIPADQSIDCSDYIVLPAATDIHVHMRGWQQLHKEDWGSGSRSALAGGVTVVVDQPNTIPPLTNPEAFCARVREAQDHSLCHFALNSAVTPGTPLQAMWKSGALAFGEIFCAASSYENAIGKCDFADALRYIGRIGTLASIHAEEVSRGPDDSLAEHAALRSSAGELRVVRAVERSNAGNCRLHFCHISTRESVDVATSTIEVTPHHLLLSYEQFEGTDSHGKVNPPLRNERERKSLLSRWDRIDIIASDHAPHTEKEKQDTFARAPSGVPGVETMIPLLLAEVLNKKISLRSLVQKTVTAPAQVTGIPAAGFTKGCRADFALYRRIPVRIDPDNLHSRCGWTPFEGRPAVFPEKVIMGGMVVYDNGEFHAGRPQWIPGAGYPRSI